MPDKRVVMVPAVAGLGLLAASVLQALSATGAPERSPGPAAPRPAAAIAAEGRVETYPGAEVLVSTERAGRLTAVRFLEGQAVRKGELIAELDSGELRAALAEAEARVREAEAEIRLAETSLARRRQLVEQRIAPAQDLDQARRDVETARARRETAFAEVGRHEAQLRKTRILAPISGTVVARHADAGETLEAQRPVATIADMTRLRIEAEADEADAAALAVGAAVRITSEGYRGESWRGTVEEIADAVTLRKLKPQDPGRPTDTRILSVKVGFAEKTPLKLGKTVELRIEPAR